MVWTAEPGGPGSAGGGSGATILFASEGRACLAPLPSGRAFGDLTTEELRQQLSECLSE